MATEIWSSWLRVEWRMRRNRRKRGRAASRNLEAWEEMLQYAFAREEIDSIFLSICLSSYRTVNLSIYLLFVSFY